MTTTSINRHLDDALSGTTELSALLRTAGLPSDLVQSADHLDQAVIDLVENVMGDDWGVRFAPDLRYAVATAARLFLTLRDADGAGLPLVLAREDAAAIRDALSLALVSSMSMPGG